MSIFDINKDELLRLSDVHLEELIARLAEAEIASHGHSPAYVNWSGSINASDDGIDVHVQVPASELKTGYISRPDTIFQAKKHVMTPAAIIKEMVGKEGLSTTIVEQVKKQGSYIIVSLGDDCSPPMKMSRLNAMKKSVAGVPSHQSAHLEFYDRSKLAQWLRQHPSVLLWVKRILGQGSSGWQPYATWSNPPYGSDDTLISAPGVKVRLPSDKGQSLDVIDAIVPMRELIRSSSKAVRIIGLSGVGKTRIVQALFEETVGESALDRTIAIYVDTGASHDPSAASMLERLIAEDMHAILILDNCPTELHSLLAGKVSAAGPKVRLITIEYDINDDKPQTTEVIHIEAVAPEMAILLLIRRFPNIGHNNARLIAEFADGNARVSLAIAERIDEGDSLAQLSELQLFNRLFEQRNNPSDDLREHAEILSLTYSFSMQKSETGIDELEVLGSIMGHSSKQLRRSVTKLTDRHIVQQRGHWRAILPQAIANRLAASALNSLSVKELRNIFENAGHPRLLMSFAHRLGLLHDHPIAKEIVEAWLQPHSLLGRITELDEKSMRMLNYIAPVVPEVLLGSIETNLNELNLEIFSTSSDQRLKTIFHLLQSLAYEPNAFVRSVRLLIFMNDHELKKIHKEALHTKICRFFQPYLSGTHASVEQRISVINDCLSSGKPRRIELGLKMLSTSLGASWTGFSMNSFGARPRDYGMHPNNNELIEWRSKFIDIALQLSISGYEPLKDPVRQILADKFRGIWQQKEMRAKLVEVAHKLHAHQPWGEGWKAVRSTIFFEHTQRQEGARFEPLPEILAQLESALKPDELIPEILTYVLSHGQDYWSLDSLYDHNAPDKFNESRIRLEAKAIQLGQDFAASDHKLEVLGTALFSRNSLPYRYAFGRGLAKGACNLRIYWRLLLEQLNKHPDSVIVSDVIGGFIQESDSINPALTPEFLDLCAQHPELRCDLISLHPLREFTEIDLIRCMSIIDEPGIRPDIYEPILSRERYSNLPAGRILSLAKRIMSMPNGDNVILDALCMRLHNDDGATDFLGPDLRLIGLDAAIKRFSREETSSDDTADFCMESVLRAALRFKDNEAEKFKWLDTIMTVVDKNYGYVYGFNKSITATASLMPNAFLDRVVEGSQEQQSRRQFFISRGGLEWSPLAGIDVNVLINWCQINKNNHHWQLIASGLAPWINNLEKDGLVISEPAMKLLEASPDPISIIEVFANRVSRSPISGSHVDEMQPIADAVARLAEHKRDDIAEASRIILAKINKYITCERLTERRRDITREQNFE